MKGNDAMDIPTPEQLLLFEHRKKIAIAQLETCIDIWSAWSGTYQDDGKPADISWIMRLIPQCSNEPESGWFCIRDTATPGIGWKMEKGVFHIGSVCRSLSGSGWPVTRKQFREAARKSNVSLPSVHATLFLSDRCDWCSNVSGLRTWCEECEKRINEQVKAYTAPCTGGAS